MTSTSGASMDKLVDRGLDELMSFVLADLVQALQPALMATAIAQSAEPAFLMHDGPQKVSVHSV